MPHPLCFETICVENRQFKNLEYHQRRLHHTQVHLYNHTPDWSLEDVLHIPADLTAGKYKCRLTYDEHPGQIEWSLYQQRSISTIRKVVDDHIDYRFKYNDRAHINTLFNQREHADDVLIIRNGLVSDSTFCNVAFFDGAHWITPSSPLLAGTQRAFLLETGIITEGNIAEEDISAFSHVRLFNAMIRWELAPELLTSSII